MQVVDLASEYLATIGSLCEARKVLCQDARSAPNLETRSVSVKAALHRTSQSNPSLCSYAETSGILLELKKHRQTTASTFRRFGVVEHFACESLVIVDGLCQGRELPC